MKRIIYFILVFFSGASYASLVDEQKDFFSICAMFKNESRYLLEWIEYHRIQGVEKFYLYNNDSTDDFLKILSPYVDKGIVILKNWPANPLDKNHVKNQINAYNDAIETVGKLSEWIAFIDIDEFIVPIRKNLVSDYLHEFDDDNKIGYITVNWQIFGTSSIKNLDPMQLVTESFVFRAEESFRLTNILASTQIKSIVRPVAVKSMTIHYPRIHHGYITYPGYEGFKARKRVSIGERPVNISELQINHYWTRDENFFFNVKLARKESVFANSSEKIKAVVDSLNTVYDTSIHRFLPELKQRMSLDAR